MDLFLWKAPVTDDPDSAAALVDKRFDQRNDLMFEPSVNIARFADALRALHPDDPALPETGNDDCPWSNLPFEQTDRLLVLNIRWSKAKRVLGEILPLARDHDLVVYDPQGPSVYLADDAIEAEPDYEPTALDWLKVAVIVAVFSGLTIGAWHIPIDWLRSTAVGVGSFLTIASLVIVYAMLTRHRATPA